MTGPIDVADRVRQAAPTALVAIPGTGSDADYAARAFGPAAAALGVELIGSEPSSDLVDGHLRVLDRAVATHGRIIVGGVSIGAAIAVRWALGNDDGGCAGVWAALPAWSGSPEHAIATASARITADGIERDGLDAAIADLHRTSPPWLAQELDRSWRALHPGLVPQLRQAADFYSPTPGDIAMLDVPLVVTAAVDDPIHPIEIGRAWAAAAPRSALVEVTLAQWGARPALLGDSCAREWSRLTEIAH
ncbi:alpha/beta hydrolase [Gordonia sp. ABSL1-1]|uniref:alpha/beta hydrolase n=1 Tax=Gordonia sp. ABSL1-1 TaxID=3053923 RepID=UPI0025746168|nr:alpha/beta hydrolase [Gordonia sp. ABSL1-1]MDL9936394.1 alpha/beta hydrolase [Gordonia sp. ABSL1-1]